MNQLTLSTDLQVITAEINSYKQVAGQSLFEIGKRLNHVKENDLVHGQYIDWLETIEIDRFTAAKMIQAYEQFSNVATSAHLPAGKIFEMISLPESIDRSEFVEQEHVVPSTGESKKVESMTVKELREVKKALKESEQEKESAELRAEEIEANRQSLIQQHTEQQEKLLAQIDELKKKRSMSTEDKAKVQKLTEENIALNLSMEQLRDEYEQRVSKLEDDRHSIRKLREAFKNILTTVNAEHSQAEYYFRSTKELKDSQDAVKQFLEQWESEVIPRLEAWKAALNIPIEEGGSKNANTRRMARSEVVIDIAP
ncbi:hypothetical protein BSK49_19215 [Paenibacillus odorifer]|uniref:DUF3102 domain-containing protein n=1 Tax=Paenibacillus odorifer TaxID=189426 RepID=A0ABX3GR10_9BACL|nr:hypothetical protein [Paenibacillus odorifer]OMD34642.1 hypothetical protein BSO21_10775 [Paenibacillus odorifer]OMD85647.1 hypothetical protein BSK49_19215 [Paenibacillus odorifer]